MELGQKRFKAGAYDGASEAFQSAADLASGPGTEEAAALAARAAALLQLGRFRATVDDCTQSLRALVRAARALGMAAQGGELEASGDPLGMLREMGAPGAWGGGEKEGLVLMKAVGRRAVALGHLRQYEEAWRDFSSLGELYRAANMEDRARAAEDDGARMMRLWKEEELAGDKGASKGEERAAPQALTASEGA